jgi:hypothetical protein
MKVTRSYPGRSCTYLGRRLTEVPPDKNLCSDGELRCKKSAEAIVVRNGDRETAG